MENQRRPDEENHFERDTRDYISSGSLAGAQREDIQNDLDEEDETRWDDELELSEDLDEE